jgi:hypothetical protein
MLRTIRDHDVIPLTRRDISGTFENHPQALSSVRTCLAISF